MRFQLFSLLLLSLSQIQAFSMTAPSASSSSNTNTASDYLSSIPQGAPDAILGIAENFKKCTDPNKVNVCVGAYRDENGKPWILPSVKAAEQVMMDDASEFKEYAPIAGDAAFGTKAIQFAYGSDADLEVIARVQTLSGTGACRIGGEFLARFSPDDQKQIFIPDPTWGNHWKIFAEAGLECKPYRYYSRSSNGLDLQGMKDDLAAAPSGSIVLLHACAHNPTGCDPTLDQWKELSDLIKEKNLRVFFDSAYQGFASGNSERDAAALRLFVQEGHSVLLAQSFAKNFGLYGERCGTLSLVTRSSEEKERVMSQLKLIIRPMYSSPPIHGSSIFPLTIYGKNSALLPTLSSYVARTDFEGIKDYFVGFLSKKPVGKILEGEIYVGNNWAQD